MHTAESSRSNSAEFRSLWTRDIKAGTAWDRAGKISSISLPKSDVIQWRLEEGTLLTVRPSGTEPKIKYYILCHSVGEDLAKAKAETKRKDCRNRS